MNARRATLAHRTLAAVAFGVGGCLGDAERSNPLDPFSEDFLNEGVVTGTVTEFYPPFEGVPGVRVRLTPLDQATPERGTQTDGAGRFTLPAVPAGRYVLAAEADGYAPAADTVEIAPGPPVDATLRIDGLPRVDVQVLHTERINRFFPDPFARLVVDSVIVSDPDGVGDLGPVALVAQDTTLGFRLPLTAVTGESGVYTGSFLEDDLPVSLQDLVGRNFFVEVTDQAGQTTLGSDVHVVRLVEVYPQPLAPLDQNPVGPTPSLTWAPLDFLYTFTWSVTVYFIAAPGLEVPVATFEGLPSSQVSAQVETALQAGLHYWTVSAVDAFGNLARSTQAFFTVVP